MGLMVAKFLDLPMHGFVRRFAIAASFTRQAAFPGPEAGARPILFKSNPGRRQRAVGGSGSSDGSGDGILDPNMPTHGA